MLNKSPEFDELKKSALLEHDFVTMYDGYVSRFLGLSNGTKASEFIESHNELFQRLKAISVFHTDSIDDLENWLKNLYDFCDMKDIPELQRVLKHEGQHAERLRKYGLKPHFFFIYTINQDQQLFGYALTSAQINNAYTKEGLIQLIRDIADIPDAGEFDDKLLQNPDNLVGALT